MDFIVPTESTTTMAGRGGQKETNPKILQNKSKNKNNKCLS